MGKGKGKSEKKYGATVRKIRVRGQRAKEQRTAAKEQKTR